MFNTDTLCRALGRATRVRRAELGLSQQQFGDRCGLHRNYVGAIERAEINPTLRTQFRLAIAFAVSPTELMRRVETCLSDLEHEGAV